MAMIPHDFRKRRYLNATNFFKLLVDGVDYSLGEVGEQPSRASACAKEGRHDLRLTSSLSSLSERTILVLSDSLHMKFFRCPSHHHSTHIVPLSSTPTYAFVPAYIQSVHRWYFDDVSSSASYLGV